ncbi:hypothetical protein RUND412_001734 [Rhizina undulata]
MSSNQPIPGIVATKSNNPPPSATPSQPVASSSGNDTQRRGGGSAQTSGAAAIARSNPAAPRNNQSARKSHKNHRKLNTPREGLDEQIAMTSSSSRKGTSITHLMNWNVASRPTNEYRYRNTRRNPTWGLGSGYHAIDKARYVNANYRFIVHPRGDYRAQAVDSDVHLPWENVLQVLASVKTQCTNCPICLCTPVAPRMARCGHIFCLPCLIRYMAAVNEKELADNKKPRYKKCVICMDSVYLTDTRPVRFFTGQEGDTPREGHDIVLRLVGRRRGSTLALPKDGADTPEKLDEVPWYFAAEVMDYARIMKGTEDYMLEQYTREINELEMMEREDELYFGESGDGIKKAVAMIKTHMEGIKGMGNPQNPILEPPKQEKKKRLEIKFSEDVSDVPIMYQLQHEAHSGCSSQSSFHGAEGSSQTNGLQSKQGSTSSLPILSLPNPAPAVRVSALESSHDVPYYFYQALLYYYLSPLDIRILQATFGNYSSFPSTILPRVENVTGHLVDNELRKRARYLAHLPAGCEVGFLECDWTDIVPAEILKTFKPEIERRRKKKKDKDLKEERDRIRAEKAEEEERWAAAKLRRSGGGEEFLEEDFVALATAQSLAEASDSAFQAFPEQTVASGSQSAPPAVGSSFQRTVWGTPAVAPTTVEREIEEDGTWGQDWGDELLARLEDVGMSGGRAPSGGKGQKKKKFKKVTLMTNGGKRGA